MYKAIFRIFPQEETVQMTHLAYDWQLELNRTNQELSLLCRLPQYKHV